MASLLVLFVNPRITTTTSRSLANWLVVCLVSMVFRPFIIKRKSSTVYGWVRTPSEIFTARRKAISCLKKIAWIFDHLPFSRMVIGGGAHAPEFPHSESPSVSELLLCERNDLSFLVFRPIFYGLEAVFLLALVHRGRRLSHSLSSDDTSAMVWAVVLFRVTLWVEKTFDFSGFLIAFPGGQLSSGFFFLICFLGCSPRSSLGCASISLQNGSLFGKARRWCWSAENGSCPSSPPVGWLVGPPVETWCYLHGGQRFQPWVAYQGPSFVGIAVPVR